MIAQSTTWGTTPNFNENLISVEGDYWFILLLDNVIRVEVPHD